MMLCQICNSVFPAPVEITTDQDDYLDVCPVCLSGMMFIHPDYVAPPVVPVAPVVRKWVHETPFKSAEQRELEEDSIINYHIKSKQFT
jgi:hypothetical protein